VRRTLLGCIGCLACVGCLVASPSALAASAQSGDVCLLQGTASFSPGLTLTANVFEYTLNATLSNCHSSQSGTPESGTLEAGLFLPEQVKNSITGATDTVLYQESPVPSGEGTCASATSTGRALVTWADGTHTVMLYTAKGSLAQAFTGGVASSMTLYAVEAPEGDPSTYTIKTNRFVPVLESADGLFVLQPPEPAACNAGGVTSAAISGALGFGTPAGNP